MAPVAALAQSTMAMATVTTTVGQIPSDNISDAWQHYYANALVGSEYITDSQFSGGTLTLSAMLGPTSPRGTDPLGITQLTLNSGTLTAYSVNGDNTTLTNLAVIPASATNIIGSPGQGEIEFTQLDYNPPDNMWFLLQLGGFNDCCATYDPSTGTQLSYAYGQWGTFAAIDPAYASLNYIAPGYSQVNFPPKTDQAIANTNCVHSSPCQVRINGMFSSLFTQISIAAGEQHYFYSQFNNGSVGAPPDDYQWEGNTGNLTINGLNSLQVDMYGYACGDDRDAILAQFKVLDVPLAPNCEMFTTTAGNSFYTFSDIDNIPTQSSVPGAYYGVALIRLPLVIPMSYGYGLEMLADQINKAHGPYGGFIHTINSGVRTPVDNILAGSKHTGCLPGPGNCQPSRHMFGDAVDLMNVSRTEAEWNFVRDKAINMAGADYVEPLSGPCGKGCVHVDWRGSSGLYAPVSPNSLASYNPAYGEKSRPEDPFKSLRNRLVKHTGFVRREDYHATQR